MTDKQKIISLHGAGKTIKEIARELGKSEATVRTTLNRAKKQGIRAVEVVEEHKDNLMTDEELVNYIKLNRKHALEVSTKLLKEAGDYIHGKNELTREERNAFECKMQYSTIIMMLVGAKGN